MCETVECPEVKRLKKEVKRLENDRQALSKSSKYWLQLAESRLEILQRQDTRRIQMDAELRSAKRELETLAGQVTTAIGILNGSAVMAKDGDCLTPGEY